MSFLQRYGYFLIFLVLSYCLFTFCYMLCCYGSSSRFSVVTVYCSRAFLQCYGLLFSSFMVLNLQQLGAVYGTNILCCY